MGPYHLPFWEYLLTSLIFILLVPHILQVLASYFDGRQRAADFDVPLTDIINHDQVPSVISSDTGTFTTRIPVLQVALFINVYPLLAIAHGPVRPSTPAPQTTTQSKSSFNTTHYSFQDDPDVALFKGLKEWKYFERGLQISIFIFSVLVFAIPISFGHHN